MAGSDDPLPDLEQRVLDAGASATSPARRGAGVRVRRCASSGSARRPPAREPAGELGARILADVFARYATMRGWKVDRRGARDCHDPAVELAVERGLAGATPANARQRHGVADLAARCRAAALESAARARRAERAARAARPRRRAAARSLHPDYVESVWWAVQGDRRPGPPARAAQGRAVLPALRDGPAGRRRRARRRRGVVGDRPLRGRARRRPAPGRRRPARRDDAARGSSSATRPWPSIRS